MKYIIAWMIFITLPFLLYSQSINVVGKVINEKKETVENVQVVLKKIGETRIIAFSQTSKDGNFVLKKEVNIPPDSLELSFSCLGYALQTKKILNNNQPMLVELTSKDIKLKGVVVSPKKILQMHDTITYMVSEFSSAEDRTIGDVLKKMPGIEVAKNGQIKYQGQDINKFYIEGSDMLGGRYGLATNNISYKDVASVNIMENHQPVKALQDIVFSASPALNIKLKEDAKSRWAGTLKGGSGIPDLWTAEVFAMRFKAKTQSLETYKGNNAGNESFEMNVFPSITDFVSLMNTQLPSYIQVTPSAANDIGSDRSVFNQTNNLTSNNLAKVRKDFDLITEITGSLDHRESEDVSQTTYFLGNNQVSVEDATENAVNLQKTLTGKLQLKSNQKTYYFNNDFNFNYDRNDPAINILGTYPNEQEAGIESWKISDNFDILQRHGDKFFTFRSSNEYSSKPQFLTVTKNDQSPVSEKIALSSFYTNNAFAYSFLIGKIRIDAPIRLLYQYKQMENRLDTETNRSNTNKLRLDITPSFSRNISDLNISVSGMFFYQALALGNQAHQFFGVNPYLSFNWILSSMLTVKASASYSRNLPDESLFYYGNILNNYRNYTAGYIDFSTGNNSNISARMEYKDVIKTLFADVGVMLMKRHNTKISGQDFVGDSILNYFYSYNSNREMLSVSGSVSKGIEFINGTVFLFPAYSHNWASMLRNGIFIPYSSDTYSLSGRINPRIGTKCNLTYNVSYAINKYHMENDQQYFSSNHFSESLKVTYSLIKSLQLSYSLDHYCNELTSNNYKNFIFSDFYVSYLPGNRWEFSCFVKNIFDMRGYSYFIDNQLSTFYGSYKIRPRNILLSATYRF